MSKHIGILGEGAWGTAIATVFAHKGYTVKLWCYDADVAQAIRGTRFNERYLPGIYLSEHIIPVTTIDDAVCGSEFVFEAIPVKFLRSIIEQAKHCFTDSQTWVVLSKGIEQDTLLFPMQIIDDVFKKKVHKAVLAGPSFAHGVARKQITAVTLASENCEIGKRVQSLMACDYLRPYITLDVLGVQAGAALKNVIALAIGMLDGAGYHENSKAFILTRGLHEMATLAQALGGNMATVYGLSGVGDLVLTATGILSKNMLVGRRLGKGESLDAILEETGHIPEGVNTVQAVHQICQQKKLDLPICAGVYRILFQQESIANIFSDLMSKPLGWECREPQ